MSRSQNRGSHDDHDLMQAGQMEVEDMHFPGHVPLEDLHEHLREHRPVPTFLQTNLVSDGFITTPVTDPNLVNPWGMSSTPASPIWISQNGVGLTSLYTVVHDATTGTDTVTPDKARPAVLVGTPGHLLSPTGQVFNPFNGANTFSKAFVLDNGAPATFMFATEEGTIEAWNPTLPVNTQTVTVVPTADESVYTGLAIDHNPTDTPMLYAANFSQGEVDVFGADFSKIGTITDPHMDRHFSPFNVQVLSVGSDERLFVTYARDDALTSDDASHHGHGGGFIDEFDLQGHLVQRIDSHDTLDTPWGLAIAPASFGAYAGDLLVANHGDGTISVFDLDEHGGKQALGHLLDAAGKEITIDGLWGLIPGDTNPLAGGDPNTIYFSAGPANGAHGLFGSLTPDPATMMPPT